MQVRKLICNFELKNRMRIKINVRNINWYLIAKFVTFSSSSHKNIILSFKCKCGELILK